MRAMKDSGIEWIGEIPEEWEVGRLRYCCNSITDGSHFSPETISSGEIYITAGNVCNDKVDLTDIKYITYYDFEKLKKNGCQPKPGDVLLTKDGSVGRTAIVDDNNYVVLSSVGILTPKQWIDSRFLKYALDSSCSQEQMTQAMLGSALRRITLSKIKEFCIVIPSLAKQKSIISYLDSKCSKIDSIVAKQQQLIEKLKEYKQAVITEAVTKGLNPDVPMKDSGIEWIGEIPEGWKVIRLKFVCKIKIGVPHEKEWLSSENMGSNIILVNSKFVSTNGVVYKNVPMQIMPLHTGDICTVLSDLPNGRALARCYLIEEENKYTLNQRVAAYYDYKLNRDYFLYYMDRNRGLLKYDDGVNQTNLKNDQVRNCYVLIPPPKEQDNIACFIKRRSVELDQSISRRQQLITKLQEYKKSLIYEVVTGKREVPNG